MPPGMGSCKSRHTRHAYVSSGACTTVVLGWSESIAVFPDIGQIQKKMYTSTAEIFWLN